MHDADPGAEGGVSEAIAEAGDGVDDDEGGERWVSREYGVGDEVAERSGDADATLAKLGVNLRVEDGGRGVAGEGCKKDERDNGVIEVVVLLKGRNESLCPLSAYSIAVTRC